MIDCGQQAMRTHCFSSSLHSRPRAVQAIIQPNRSRVAQPAPLQPGLQVHTVLVALTEHAALAPHPPLLGVLQSAVGAGCAQSVAQTGRMPAGPHMPMSDC